MSELIEPIPFQLPSPELFEMLQWLEDAFEHVMQIDLELVHEELLAFTELTPLQVERLLTRGAL